MEQLLLYLHGLYGWTLGWAESPYGLWALFALAFAESSFFPIPPDVLLMALSIGNPAGAFRYAFVCSFASVLGGCVGYGIGYWGGRPLMERIFGRARVQMVHTYFQKYEAWAVAIAGFTPIPYKVFTIGAGVFFVDFKTFVLASAASRSARFFLVAWLLYIFGAPIKGFIDRYFEILTIVFFILLIGGFWAVKRMAARSVKEAAVTDQ